MQRTQKREVDRRQKKQDKQAKATVTLIYKKERESQRQFTIVTRVVTTIKLRIRRPSIDLLKPHKKVVNPYKKTLKAVTGSQREAPRSIKEDSSSTAGPIDIVVTKSQIMSRRGRTIALSQRFRG